MLRKLSAAFTGGVIGGLLSSLLFWELGRDGVLTWMGIALRPALSLAWLYPRLIVGGLWGLLLILPLLPGRPASRGLLGLGYGALTPALILLIYAVWGVSAALWHRAASR
jgi:hypothetical protein